jgi:hypothetical protein
MTLKELVQRTKDFLGFRAQAYRACFPRESPMADVVLADLASFCRANESTFHTNEAVAHRLDGRREVWLRIQHHLKLSGDDLMKIYADKLAKKDAP